MPFAAAAATVAAAGVGAYEQGQAADAQAKAIAPTQQAQGVLYNDAENIASTPYTAYTGQETAGISTNQQKAIDAAGAQSTDGASADATAASGQAAYIAGNQWNQGTESKFANPYTQDVTNAALGVEQRNYQGQVNTANANAAQSGAFGGDRATLSAAALAGQNQLNQGTTQAQGAASAYTNAQAAWEADNTRAASAAQQYDAAGTAITNAANANITNLSTTGGVQQQTQQAADSAKYNDYLDQRSWAANQLAPLEASVGKNVYSNPAPVNYASAALGAAASAVGKYGSTSPDTGGSGSNPDNSNPDNLGGATETAPAGSSLQYDSDGNITGSVSNSGGGSYFGSDAGSLANADAASVS